MTLLAAHELGFALALCASLVAVLQGGELPQACWGMLAVVPASAALALTRRSLPVWAGTVVALSFMVAAAAVVLAGGAAQALVAACIFLLGTLCARLLTRTWPSHDLQALVLSLLLVFAGTLVHQGIGYAAVLIVYTVAATWSLLTRQLLAGCWSAYFRDGSAAELHASLMRRDVVTPRFFALVSALALTILLGTGALFVLFPRVGMSGLGAFGRGSRLPPGVSLTGAPRAAGGSEVVARIYGLLEGDFDRGLYVRGRVYDALTPQGFARVLGGPEAPAAHQRLRALPEARDYEIFTQPVDDDHLLALGPVQGIQIVAGEGSAGASTPTLQPSVTGEVVSRTPLAGPVRLRIRGQLAVPHLDAPARGAAPAVALDLDPDGADAAFSAHYLRLPADLDPRVVPLAREVVAGARPFAERARRLREHLLRHYSYTLEQPNGARADPLAGFLFDDPRGHCEYFAAALATLLRAAGVPSRVVGGYQGGAWDPVDRVVRLTAGNAHAWVEWYLPGAGWVVDDATPPSDPPQLRGVALWLERAQRGWDESVVNFGMGDQLAVWRALGSGMQAPRAWVARRPAGAPSWRNIGASVLLGSPLGLALVLLLRRIRQRRASTRLGRALEDTLARLHGAPLPPARTFGAAIEALQERMPAADLAVLLGAHAIYQRLRFGPTPLTRRTRRLCAQLRALPRPR